MWSVIKQPRKSGPAVYICQWKGAEKRPSVTIGPISGEPATLGLTALLREVDPDASWTDEEIRTFVVEPDPVRRGYCAMSAQHRIRMERVAMMRKAPVRITEPDPDAPKQPHTVVKLASAKTDAPVHARGGTTLRTYVEHTWTQVRQRKAATWKRESWWWTKRILPSLGSIRLCDLDTATWTAFLDTLKIGGRSKALCQTAYRTALTHAAEDLHWIPEVHRFEDIAGSTKRSLDEPEPMTADEVAKFLSATTTDTHRAMFAVQIGQGLRPSEVIRIRWEDIDWGKRILDVRGTKNDLADAKVGLTPLSFRELHAYWTKLGCPSVGVAFLKTRGTGPFAMFPDSAFYSAAKKSGLNDERTRGLFPYVARHSFATIAATSGIDRAHTKSMMRHSRKSTVLEEAYERVSKTETAIAFSKFGT